MHYTLTKHKYPQPMSDIMSQAWLIKRVTDRPFGDYLRASWAIARERAGPKLPTMPQNLSQYLHRLGGLVPCPELRLIAAPLMLLNRHGHPIDYAARLASDDGFDIRDDPNVLIDCIRDEMSGHRHYAQQDQIAALDATDWDTYSDAGNDYIEVPF